MYLLPVTNRQHPAGEEARNGVLKLVGQKIALEFEPIHKHPSEWDFENNYTAAFPVSQLNYIKLKKGLWGGSLSLSIRLYANSPEGTADHEEFELGFSARHKSEAEFIAAKIRSAFKETNASEPEKSLRPVA